MIWTIFFLVSQLMAKEFNTLSLMIHDDTLHWGTWVSLIVLLRGEVVLLKTYSPTKYV